MRDIYCLAEHRRGELRAVSLEVLSKARQLAEGLSAGVVAVLLGNQVGEFAKKLALHADRVVVVEDDRLREFNQAEYQSVLCPIIKEHAPLAVMMGHTAFGMDIAPSLAVECNLPFAPDCVDVIVTDGRLQAVRQMYGGKVNALVSFPFSEGCVLTLRPGIFTIRDEKDAGQILNVKPADALQQDKRFLGYVDPDVGDVDICQAKTLVAVGRGIKKKENLALVQALADVMGGTVACSRPVVDSEWLSKDRQVGQSGKTVKPRLYLAAGISGAFQHVTGMRGSETIVAINKDANAPIMGVADYAIVDDLFKVLPALTAKIREMKQ